MTLKQFLKEAPKRDLQYKKQLIVREEKEDKYYQKLGEEIENHPIFMPRIVRGT
jgi:hypothetical protein